MGLFNHFPYTNFHELNLDWILKKIAEIEKMQGEKNIQFYRTVDDMKQSNTLVENTLAITAGYHAVNDGGGGVYIIKNTTEYNDMDIIKCNQLEAHLLHDKTGINIRTLGAIPLKPGELATVSCHNFIHRALELSGVAIVDDDNWYTASPINLDIRGCKLECRGVLNYIGPDSAIIISKRAITCNVKDLNSNGNGIEIAPSSGSGAGTCDYVNVNFVVMETAKHGILLNYNNGPIEFCNISGDHLKCNTLNGNYDGVHIEADNANFWCSANTFNGMQLNGRYGVYIKGRNQTRCYSNNFEDIHIEGETTGAIYLEKTGPMIINAGIDGSRNLLSAVDANAKITIAGYAYANTFLANFLYDQMGDSIIEITGTLLNRPESGNIYTHHLFITKDGAFNPDGNANFFHVTNSMLVDGIPRYADPVDNTTPLTNKFAIYGTYTNPRTIILPGYIGYKRYGIAISDVYIGFIGISSGGEFTIKDSAGRTVGTITTGGSVEPYVKHFQCVAYANSPQPVWCEI